MSFDDHLRQMTHPVAKLLLRRRQQGDALALKVRKIEDVPEWLKWQMFTCFDAEALAAYDQHGISQLGRDPLGGGAAFDWPAELTDVPPGHGLVEVTEDAPIIGWRYWTVRDNTLLAPFQCTPERAGLRGLGVEWQPRMNTSDHRRCGRSFVEHPAPVVRCTCGIRAMQSLRAIVRFASAMTKKSQTPGAFAVVALWGRVAGPAAGDDWRFTARGQHAKIVGPLYLDARFSTKSQELAERYNCHVITYADYTQLG